MTSSARTILLVSSSKRKYEETNAIVPATATRAKFPRNLSLKNNPDDRTNRKASIAITSTPVDGTSLVLKQYYSTLAPTEGVHLSRVRGQRGLVPASLAPYQSGAPSFPRIDRSDREHHIGSMPGVSKCIAFITTEDRPAALASGREQWGS